MKKIIYHPYWLCLFLLFSAQALSAQDAALTADFKKATIERLSQMLEERYVFPDMAKATNEHLKKQLEAGVFDKNTDLKSFAEALTEEAQSITKEKHMRVRPAPARAAQTATIEQQVDGMLEDKEWERINMVGFMAAERLPGNIGYLDLRGFAHPQAGVPVADHYMALLGSSDAIIIDLRKNGGGSPEMVQYLCSFFFDKKVHLNSLYYREGDRTEEYWTLEKLGGEKMPDVPLFVLTSNNTFSGAEEFSYNMQTQKRATLVGETTGGGANPGGMMPINDKLGVFIPTGKAINPITKTNWEGVGVVPEVQTTAEEALAKATELAVKAAKDYRQKRREKFKPLLLEVYTQLDKVKEGSEAELLAALKKTCEADLLGEQEINGMGYEYLMQHQKPKTAEAIFYCNTMLHPNSANCHDSYAEALLANGKTGKAVESYRKAVELGKASNDANLELFKENLKKAETAIKNKP